MELAADGERNQLRARLDELRHVPAAMELAANGERNVDQALQLRVGAEAAMELAADGERNP